MDTFGKRFGSSFQIKILSALLSDRIFLQTIYDIIKDDYFDSDANQWILSKILTHFDKYKQIPTLDVFKTESDALSSDILRQSVSDNLRNVWGGLESTELEYIKEQSLEFCKNQEVKNAILESVGLLESGNYEEIQSKITAAMKAGQDTDIGHEYNISIDERYADSVRNVITTGWPAIDELVDGGFGKGELIIFAAPPGIGKSWALINVGMAAVRAGKTVVHYTLELNEGYVGQRYDAVLTNMAVTNLKYNIDDVKSSIKELSGELIIKYWPTKSASVNSVRASVDKLILQGKKPDIIIVDYADLLKGNSKREKHEEIEEVVEELRGLAGEYEVPLYTASQINRCHNVNDNVETPTGDKRIGDVEIGDQILTHKGFKKITNVFPIERQPTYRIKLKDGREINVSAEHMIPTQYNKIKSIADGLSVGEKLFVKKSGKK